MSKCWAHSLGNCSKKISREHVVSGGLFVTDLIDVQGFPWCKDERKRISVASLTSKILCEKHNNLLSDLDNEASKVFDNFREMRRTANMRENRRPRPWRVVRYEVDGLLIERWFLKTLINFSSYSDLPVGSKSADQGFPTPELTEIAFGIRSFPGKAGLYLVGQQGQQINSVDNVTFTPLLNNGAYVAGGLFSFRGFTYLLFLLPQGPPDPLDNVFFLGLHLGDCQIHYHHPLIREFQGRYLSQTFAFRWQNVPTSLTGR